MCGICGQVARQPDLVMSEAQLVSMCQRLHHRGPDDEGYFSDRQARLGMRRLSIIDLATGQQPVTNENQTVWLVFNGEIYNYQALRGQLEQRGHVFTSQSDSEVIIHAYEEFQDECLRHLDGMFAIAVWDAPRRRLLLARDRLGIKPLYYWTGRDQIVFASELKAILDYPAVERSIDPTALDQFLTLEYIPAPRTIFRGIYKLPAGHQLVFGPDGLAITPYWDIAVTPFRGEASAAAEELRDRLRDTVRRHMVSDVPLGAFLSGGIDSSTVVAFMSEASASPVQTFSIGFDDASYNELPDARALSVHVGARHRERVLAPQIARLACELIPHFDEPFADFSIFPTYLVSKLASESVKVVLSGDGGDEVFGGYDAYVAEHLDRHYYRRLPSRLRQNLLPALIARLRPQPAKKGLVNTAKRFVEGAARSPALQHVRWMTFMTDEDRRELYQPDWRASVPDGATATLFETLFQKVAHLDPLAQQQYVDLKTYLADDILTKVDRMSMAASIEARVPFLDHRIVEFGISLPAAMKLNRTQTKVVLRRAMQEHLPERTLRKPKQGFSIPLKQWLHGPLEPLMTDLLSAESIGRRGYFRPETVTHWIAEHRTGQANYSHRLWALMVLEIWHRAVLERSAIAV